MGANGVVVSINIKTLIPGPPSSITVPSSAIANAVYDVSFGSATGMVISYRLEESTDPAFPSGICTKNIPPTCYGGPVLVYQGPNLLVEILGRPVGTYYYRVQACNQYGCGQYITGTNGVVATLP